MTRPPGSTPDTEERESPRGLHPLPRGLVEFYGLIAVLMVLIPEWMASGTLKGFRDHRRGADLPVPSGAWQRIPELRLAAMSLAELRLQARAMRVWGYAGLDRSRLQARMLRRLRRRPERRLEAGGRP